MSNIPAKISNVTTRSPLTSNIYNNNNSLKSDHAVISAIYIDKEIQIPPRFYKFRDNKLLTKNRLCDAFYSNEKLNTVFNHSNPNKIADILVTEVSNIIEWLSPSKLIQHKNSYAPWLNKQYFIEVAKKDKIHKMALTSNNPNIWREFRSLRNKINRMNTFLKKQ